MNNFRLKMQNFKLKTLILWENLRAELKFWAPVIFSVANLQLLVVILSAIFSVCRKIATFYLPYFLNARHRSAAAV